MIFLLSCTLSAPLAADPAPVPAPVPVPVPAPTMAPDPLAAFKVLEKPLPFDEERTRLTLDYRKTHQGYTGDSIRIIPEVVVLHWTGGSSAQSAWNTFAPTRAADARPELAGAAAVNVSAHFIVEQDGTIWRLMPEETMARHCIGLNHLSIGIENVGDADLGSNGKSPLTTAQVAADVALIRSLKLRWPIQQLIGHLEYQQLEGGPRFLELDPHYRTGKPDPGAAFMKAVRAAVADLDLMGT